MVAFDVTNAEEVMFHINLLLNSSDNPMTCECASHIGLRGNFFCPRCNIGGTTKEKQADEGFHSLFSVRITILIQ